MFRVRDVVVDPQRVQVSPENVYKLMKTALPAIRFMLDKRSLPELSKVELSDFHSVSACLATLESRNRFQAAAAEEGYKYMMDGLFLRVFHDGKAVESCPIQMDDCHLRVDMKVMLHSRSQSYHSFQKLMSKFPYVNPDVVPYYDDFGVKFKDAPAMMPQFMWDAARGVTLRNVKKTSEEMTDKLIHLFKVVNGDEEREFSVSCEQALAMLSDERTRRLGYSDRGVGSKVFMTLAPYMSTTFNKFYDESITGVVYHAGSGPKDRLSRYGFPNADKVIGIDPVADGEGDYQMHWDAFVGKDPNFDGVSVVSDACVNIEVGVGAVGRQVTGLDEAKTNELANSILISSLGKASKIVLKIALQDIRDVPSPMAECRYILRNKVRLHNAEIIVEVNEGGEPLGDIMERVAYVVYNANRCRQEMDVYKVYPTGKLKDDTSEYRPTVRQICAELCFSFPAFEGGIRVPSKEVRKLNLSSLMNHKLKDLGSSTYYIDSDDLVGMDFQRAFEYVARQVPWKGKSDIASIVASAARNRDLPPHLLVKNIIF